MMLRLDLVWMLIGFVTIQVHTKNIPNRFFGKYVLEKSINLDDYLAARVASVTKVIRKAASGTPTCYDMETLTWHKNVIYRDFKLGQQFTTEHLEDGLYNVTIDLNSDGDVITEQVMKIDDAKDDEIFEYIRDGDFLVMQSSWNGVDAAAYYRKVCAKLFPQSDAC